jgi:hypothetical protein
MLYWLIYKASNLLSSRTKRRLDVSSRMFEKIEKEYNLIF